MTRKTRKPRKSKAVYYFIVEGCTEENYIRLLKTVYRKPGKIKNLNLKSDKKCKEYEKALDHPDRIPNYKKSDCRLLEKYITKEKN